ncbi:ABC transporter substrate-binding protein [Caldovatus sediminis]|jgi:C4-dicarboxylate-binding protein DctP|uniref:ABC transporter substrate-binding protein n=1 Tax=Caldovatus sediminis TaxID=2041189 RepID=A0A8J2ZCR1_9PROT|nr:TRAP transporter substrate-binding protein DctP [Caldovatus sediminis]GGG37351.1 ABC transporter substrate-binding protein [Caldovatus sediminis]
MRRRTLVLAAGAGLSAPLIARPAAAQVRLRISLDTNPTHVRNRNAERFVEELRKRAGDQIQAEIFPSAQLFRDRDIARALRQGSVEMGIPGTWNLDGIEPNTAITSLPMFYGVPPEVVRRVGDGPVGQQLNERMEQRLRVKVLGRWFNLGYNHFYGVSRPLNKYEDLRGLRVRHPGGSANAARIRVLGGSPVLIPWPDLPLAMSQGVVDALITTHESAVTSKLWDSGLRYSFEDRQYFSQYVPMVSTQFWSRLSPELQTAMAEAWEAIVDGQREQAEAAQAAARDTLISNGVRMAQPSAEELADARRRLMAAQDEIIAEIKIDRDMVEKVMNELRAANVSF